MRNAIDAGAGQHMAAHGAKGEGAYLAVEADQGGLAAGAAEIHGQHQAFVVAHWAHKDVAPEAFTAMGVEAFRGFRN